MKKKELEDVKKQFDVYKAKMESGELKGKEK